MFAALHRRFIRAEAPAGLSVSRQRAFAPLKVTSSNPQEVLQVGCIPACLGGLSSVLEVRAGVSFTGVSLT